MVARNALALAAALVAGCTTIERYDNQFGMSFFVTSRGAGKGADFGRLAGADAHCQTLARAAGAGLRTWRACQSTTASADSPTRHARERIGNGPWRNAKGVVIAHNLDELHGRNNLNQETALTEKGAVVNGSTDTPNRHDILTGSAPNGVAMGGATDTTCANWTSSGKGSAIVGHHDRRGLRDDEPSRSWNSAHATRGCGEEALRETGGAGFLYCFAPY